MMFKRILRAIHGDVAISRNAIVGGDEDVRGRLTVHKHLKVEGWLDAPNIRGPLKGLFKDPGSLERAYPRPVPGWYALVGEELPAEVYVVEQGRWVGSGRNSGELTVDLVEYEQRMCDVENEMIGIREEWERIMGRWCMMVKMQKQLQADLEAEIKTRTEQGNKLQNGIDGNALEIASLRESLNKVDSTLSGLSEWMERHRMQYEALLSGHGQHTREIADIKAHIQSTDLENGTRFGALETMQEELGDRLSTAEDEIESLRDGVARNRRAIAEVSDALDTLTGTKGTAGIIDTFRDVEDFLAGFSDSETETLKRLLDSKADGAAVSESIRRLSETGESLARYCDNLALALNEYQHRDYRSVVQLGKVSLDPNEMVSVEYVDEPVTLGGVVEYYEPGYFVLLATDGKRYDRWSQRWRIYNDEGQVRTDVLFMYDNKLWQWTGKTLMQMFSREHEAAAGGCDCVHEEITEDEITELLGGRAPDVTPGGPDGGCSCGCEHEEITDDDISALLDRYNAF